MFKKIILLACVAAPTLFVACDGTPTPTLKTEVDTLTYALGISQSPTKENLIQYLASNEIDSTYIDEFMKGFKEGLESSNDKKKLAYQMGIQAGSSVKTRMFPEIEKQVFADDSTQHLSVKNFLAGFMEGYNDKFSIEKLNALNVTRDNANQYITETMKKLQEKANEKAFGANKKAGEDFIAKKKKEAGVKSLGSVFYKELKAGTGAIPTASDIVTVEYEGRLIDGTVFDSSASLPNKTAEFPCSGVIKGFSIALTNMKVDAEWEVYIPQEFAYGGNSTGAAIKPFSALIFKIKLVGIKKAATQQKDIVLPTQSK